MERTIYENYVEQIQKFPLLTAEQERALSIKIHSGNENAKMELIQSNLRLVVSIAKKYNTVQINIMDLIQEGNIGLMTAAGKYHYSFNTRFSTYSYSWIQQSMLRYLHNKTPIISIPGRKEELLRRINIAQAYLFQCLSHKPSTEELAVYLGLPEEELSEVLSYSYSVSSLDAELDDSNEITAADFLPDMTYAPETICMAYLKKEEVRNVLKNLPEMEYQVIFYRYNIGNDRQNWTLRQIGNMLGVSAETVRQIEMRALKRLRKAVASSDLLSV